MNFTYITALPALPRRDERGHKGTFGTALIIAGSTGMSGAASLAGLGALRGGTGLVRVAIPREIAPIVAGWEPAYLTVPLEHDSAGRISASALRPLLTLAEQSTAVAIGPGLGQSPDLNSLVAELYREVSRPLVVDADALNALASLPGGIPKKSGGPRILTPHPGEFARLAHSTVREVQAARQSLSAEFAERHQLILLLKGYETVITDGQRVAVNSTGNSGMATGGTGDVLTGLIAALLAQGIAPFAAAHLGAHLHGLAGDIAASQLTEPGLIASDLPRFIPTAWKQLGIA